MMIGIGGCLIDLDLDYCYLVCCCLCLRDSCSGASAFVCWSEEVARKRKRSQINHTINADAGLR